MYLIPNKPTKNFSLLLCVHSGFLYGNYKKLDQENLQHNLEPWVASASGIHSAEVKYTPKRYNSEVWGAYSCTRGYGDPTETHQSWHNMLMMLL